MEIAGDGNFPKQNVMNIWNKQSSLAQHCRGTLVQEELKE